MDNNHPISISRLQAWVLATRPKTLPAAVSPVLVGCALAFRSGHFKPVIAFAALAVSLLLQIGVNLANDYFDFKRGVDTKDRLGPTRVTQSGLIPPATVKNAMSGVLLLAGIAGLYLVYVGGWPILLLGVASILSALAYSGGPFPLASNGLGDLFVFIFFGPVAVCGTYYLQTMEVTGLVILLSICPGFLITAILVVNNTRDIETDSEVGKRTLAVMLGIKGSRVEYLLLLIIAYLIPTTLVLMGMMPIFLLFVLLSLPAAYLPVKSILNESGPVLNQALAGTAKLTFWFCLFLSIGLSLK
ncbi:MAG: 1,4-dihydroxy-2-naphthoate polyprenyltransferase [Proteobacteria bacterium]|nr:1,4-dihydroxy-2-naphthoate polyprenyltransferase [Pseudomonadota bacterium]